MKKLNKFFIVFMIAVCFFSEPRVLAWWSLIYPVEYAEENEEKEVKLFFVEWIKAIRACKKR